MGLIGSLLVKLGVQTASFDSKMKQSGARVRRFGHTARSSLGMAKAAFAGFAAVGGIAAIHFGRKLLDLASIAEETNSKFQAVFKNEGLAAERWATAFSVEVGRSTTELKGFLATIQDTFVPLGFARDAAREMSQRLVRLAVDLASFNNTTDAGALRDLQSAIVGNHETMRKYGVIINQTMLGQQMLKMGFGSNVLAATEQQKALARLEIILASTTDAQGDAARTADSYANQMKRLGANLNTLGEQVGNELVPAIKSIATALNENIPAIAKWVGTATRAFRCVGAIAGAVFDDMKAAFENLWGDLSPTEVLKGFATGGVAGVMLKAKKGSFLGDVSGGFAEGMVKGGHPLFGLIEAAKGGIGAIEKEKARVTALPLGKRIDQAIDKALEEMAQSASAAQLASRVKAKAAAPGATAAPWQGFGFPAGWEGGAEDDWFFKLEGERRAWAAELGERRDAEIEKYASAGQAMAQAMRTPLETFTDRLKEVADLLARGAITGETGQRARAMARDQLFGAWAADRKEDRGGRWAQVTGRLTYGAAGGDAQATTNALLRQQLAEAKQQNATLRDLVNKGGLG